MASGGDRSVDGRAVLVTGAASGIGRATAELFATEGATVAAVDLSGDAVAQVVAGVEAAGGTAVGRALDVSDAGAVAETVDALIGQLGRLDIVVNNAGISQLGAIDSEDDFDGVWERTLAVNLTAHTTVVRAALPALERSDAGRIVNIASVEGLGAQPALAAYVAAKHGVVGLTKSMAVDLGRRGITANAICPGPIATGMTAGIPDEAKERFARRKVPLGRYGRPDEIAQMVLNLSLPASSYVTGAIIPVDGGMTAQN
ncbi:MAG: SDR family NAD(P)-dependent oxidoreductase [Actinomycetota bacterium]